MKVLSHERSVHCLVGAEARIDDSVHRRPCEVVLRVVGDVQIGTLLDAEGGDVGIRGVDALGGIGKGDGGSIVLADILPRLFDVGLDARFRLLVKIIEDDVGIEAVLIQRRVVGVEHLLRRIELALVEEPLVEEHALRMIDRRDGDVLHFEGDGNGLALPAHRHGDAARIDAGRLIEGNVEADIEPLVLAREDDVLPRLFDIFVRHERIGIVPCRHIAVGLGDVDVLLVEDLHVGSGELVGTR